MIDKDLIITQQDLVDWIDRPLSNDDLDLCSYLSNAVKNQYEYKEEIDKLTAESTEWESKYYKFQNIIDGLEKWLEEQHQFIIEIPAYTKDISIEHKTMEICYENVLDKLNELKGDNK